MKRLFLLLVVLLLAFPSFAHALPVGAAVAESDGDPSGWAYKFVFTNGSLSLLNGVATVTLTGGLTPGATGGDVFAAANAAAIKAILGYMTDLVDDTSPTAGGDIDMSTFGIYGAFTNLTAASATPSVAAGMNFLTANATADVNITDFTGTTVGMPFRVVIADDYTDIDFSGAALRGHGEALLDDPPIGTMLTCIDDGTFIDCDVSQWTSMSLNTWIHPTGATPAQTVDGQDIYDTTNDWLTIGDGAAPRTYVSVNTKTDELACSYESATKQLECDGSVGALTSSGTITSSGTYDVTGANPMTLGSADVTAFTLSGASETLVITPTTDQFTVTTGTGATTLYFSGINVSTSGDLKGNIASYDDADGDTQLTAANCNGQVIYNTTKANAYVLPPAASGLNICFYATSAHAITITPYAAGNDHIWYGASDCGEDDDLVGPATIGSFVCLHARDAVNWMTWGSANTWVCE